MMANKRYGISHRIFALILSVLLALSCLVMLSSCHGKAAAELRTELGTLDPNKEYNITFWAKNDSNYDQQAVYRKAVEDFQRLYPNIKVKLKLYSNYEDIDRDVKINIASGDTPNVCITYPDYIASYLEGDNLVLPLDGFMSDSRYGFGGSELRFDAPSRDQMIEQFMSEGVIGGKQYALPFMRSTEALYVNETYAERLLLELGYDGLPDVWTWDLVWEVSEKAMEKNVDGTYKINGKRTLIPFMYKSTDNMMITMLKQKNIPYTDDGGGIYLFNDDTAAILQQVAYYSEIGAFSTFNIDSYPANWLNRGECIFAVDSTAGASWMGSDAPNLDINAADVERFETGVYLVPQYDTENPRMMSQGPSVCIFNKEDDGEILASWLFTQYLLTNEVQLGYAYTEGYVPVTKCAQSSAEYQDYLSRAGEKDENGAPKELYYDIKIEASKLFNDNIENTFVTPVFSGSAKVRSAAGQLIENMCRVAKRHDGTVVDGTYIKQMYTEVMLLKNISGSYSEMPGGSITLIVVICAVWLLIAAYVIWQYSKKRRKRRSTIDNPSK